MKFAFITTTINKPIFLEDYLKNFKLNFSLGPYAEFQLNNNLNELKMEISQLSRGDRISKYAIDELGMIPAIPETLIIEINSYN